MTASDVTQDLRVPSGAHVPPGYPRPFGAYLLLSPLAAGGMGEVFLASSRGSAGAVRLVVIKTLRPDLAKEPGYVNRFLDEARIVVQLQHSNICQVFDVGKQDGAHYFAMEHIAGTNLRRLLDALAQAGKTLPPSIALYVVAEALEGLDAAHRHRHPLTGQLLNVVHRDVSPHNVMVSFEGDVKLIDFGLAASDMKMEHTESQVVMGKIAYMSPEQARGEPVNASSDQFSAGILLYELLAGERYYGDMSQREIWSTAGSRGYVPRRWDQIEDDVANVLRRALATEPKDRFPSCREFASAVRVILKQRYPYAEKAMLRSFVRDAVAQELETSEATLRNLGTIAMNAMPSLDDSAAVAAFTPKSGEHRLQLAASPEAGTGSTRTWMVFGRQRTSGVPLAVGAAVGGIAIGAFMMLLFVPRLTSSSGAGNDVVLPVGAIAAPVAVVSTTSPATPTVPMSPSAPVDARAVDESDVARAGSAARSEAMSDVKAPRDSKRDAKRTPTPTGSKSTTKKSSKPPRWMTWTEARKLDALSGCSDRCVTTLRNVKARNEKIETWALETCLEKCVKR